MSIKTLKDPRRHLGRTLSVALTALFLTTYAAAAVQVSVGVALPGVSIGINVPMYPHLEQVPGYPVYYDPQASDNYFFYDGLYWVYRNDNWYESTWYNGPWRMTEPLYVPAYVLRVPVRYYRQPPSYFRGWRADAPPRWDQHWGNDWQQRRRGWDQWDRRSTAAAAPLPTYQLRYRGDQYPHAPQQQEAIRSEQYRYQPREAVTQQRWEQRDGRGSAPSEDRSHLNRPEQQRYAYPQQQQHARPPQPEPRENRQQPPQQAPQTHTAQPPVHEQRAPVEPRGNSGEFHSQPQQQPQDKRHDKGDQQGRDQEGKGEERGNGRR